MDANLFPPARPAALADLELLLDAVEKCYPVPSRFRSGIPGDVADLSRSLTAERADRDGGYLGKPAALSAYLRYFLPWNAYRLARLLPSLPLALKDGDTVLDLGSGPLTVPIALWLARPELRSAALEFVCLDRTGKVLEAGEAVFAALAAATGGKPWKVKTIRGSLGARIDGPKAALVTAANVLNELFWDDRTPVDEQAERKAQFLSALAREDGSVLVVEPGIPRSGEFVSALRGAFLEIGRGPVAPCTHRAECPLPGGHRGAKWCHFAFDTDDAPARLLKLSAAAGIPKERATLSFLLAGPVGAAPEEAAGKSLVLRVVSDAFVVGEGRRGRYACGPAGLALVAGRGNAADRLASGALYAAAKLDPKARRDEKSGAVLILLDSDASGAGPRESPAGTDARPAEHPGSRPDARPEAPRLGKPDSRPAPRLDAGPEEAARELPAGSPDKTKGRPPRPEGRGKRPGKGSGKFGDRSKWPGGGKPPKR